MKKKELLERIDSILTGKKRLLKEEPDSDEKELYNVASGDEEGEHEEGEREHGEEEEETLASFMTAHEGKLSDEDKEDIKSYVTSKIEAKEAEERESEEEHEEGEREHSELEEHDREFSDEEAKDEEIEVEDCSHEHDRHEEEEEEHEMEESKISSKQMIPVNRANKKR